MMDLRFTLKAVQSLQSFSADIEDDVVLFGEMLGVPVEIRSPNPALLHKLDELLTGIQESSNEDDSYTPSADYSVGGLGDE